MSLRSMDLWQADSNFALATLAHAERKFQEASAMFHRCGVTRNLWLGWHPKTARAMYREAISMGEIQPSASCTVEKRVRMLNVARMTMEAFPYEASIDGDLVIILNQLAACEMERQDNKAAERFRNMIRLSKRALARVLAKDQTKQLVAAGRQLPIPSLDRARCYELAGRCSPDSETAAKCLEEAHDELIALFGKDDRRVGMLHIALGEVFLQLGRETTRKETRVLRDADDRVGGVLPLRGEVYELPRGRFSIPLDHLARAQVIIDREFGRGSQESFQLLKRRLELTGLLGTGPELCPRIEKESPYLDLIRSAVSKYSSFLKEGYTGKPISDDQLARFSGKLTSSLAAEVSCLPFQIGGPIRCRSNPVHRAVEASGLSEEAVCWLEDKIVEAGPQGVIVRSGASSPWEALGDD